MHRPRDQVTRAPRAAATAAIANPILPLLRLPMKRTGSMSSKVGPALTTRCLPASDALMRAPPARPRSRQARPSARDRTRPRPAGRRSADDRHPACAQGAHVGHGRRMRHITWFIAGAMAIGRGRQAQGGDEVVGQAAGQFGDGVRGRRRDHHLLRPARQFEVAHRRLGLRVHNEVRTGRCESAWKVCARQKRCAASVIATCTSAPASRSRRTRSALCRRRSRRRRRAARDACKGRWRRASGRS